MTIASILKTVSDRAVAPDLPGITRFLNDEIRPLVRDLRAKVNALTVAIHIPEYAQGSEPTVTGSALVMNTTTGKLRYTDDGGATWTDLP